MAVEPPQMPESVPTTLEIDAAEKHCDLFRFYDSYVYVLVRRNADPTDLVMFCFRSADRMLEYLNETDHPERQHWLIERPMATVTVSGKKLSSVARFVHSTEWSFR
jgi:hypothetical protein